MYFNLTRIGKEAIKQTNLNPITSHRLMKTGYVERFKINTQQTLRRAFQESLLSIHQLQNAKTYKIGIRVPLK